MERKESVSILPFIFLLRSHLASAIEVVAAAAPVRRRRVVEAAAVVPVPVTPLALLHFKGGVEGVQARTLARVCVGSR
jgi:hypothetical protein